MPHMYNHVNFLIAFGIGGTHPFLSIGDDKMSMRFQKLLVSPEEWEKLLETIEGITSELKEIKYLVQKIAEGRGRK